MVPWCQYSPALGGEISLQEAGRHRNKGEEPKVRARYEVGYSEETEPKYWGVEGKRKRRGDYSRSRSRTKQEQGQKVKMLEHFNKHELRAKREWAKQGHEKKV